MLRAPRQQQQPLRVVAVLPRRHQRNVDDNVVARRVSGAARPAEPLRAHRRRRRRLCMVQRRGDGGLGGFWLKGHRRFPWSSEVVCSSPPECVGQPRAFRCGLMRPLWPAVAPPSHQSGHFRPCVEAINARGGSSPIHPSKSTRTPTRRVRTSAAASFGTLPLSEERSCHGTFSPPSCLEPSRTFWVSWCAVYQSTRSLGSLWNCSMCPTRSYVTCPAGTPDR